MAHVVLVDHYVELPWKRALWIGLTFFWIGLLLYVRIVKPMMMLRRPYRVTEVRPERGGAYTLTLEPEGHAGFRFKPGQFGWVSLWNGPFAIMEHPFSFSSSAERAGQVAFTIKEAGDFTSTIKDAKPGQRAYLDGPYGAFSFERHQAAGYVFLAGGVGVTPILSMLRTLAERRDRRPLLFFYGSNGWDEIIFREELDDAQEAPRSHAGARPHRSAEGLEGETGFITAAAARALSSQGSQQSRILHLRFRSDDGRGGGSARQDRRVARAHSFRTLQLRLGATMRRLYADYLVIATLVMIVALSALFAWAQQ